MAEKTKLEKQTKQMVVTKKMQDAISESKKLVIDGASKVDAAKEVLSILKGHTKKQILHVFVEGVSLTRAGAHTYYYNLVTKKS
ncbi:hypothetical protein NR756_04800 [Alloalcanivorax xenomutans]|uniref:hypothetical protein n=1 Tax=Alloalcanivorax xenomutans TaxID=1094342 RepID=UPI000E3737A9